MANKINVSQVAELAKVSPIAADALKIAARTHGENLPEVLGAALAWINEQSDLVAEVGAETVFGLMTEAKWSEQKNDYNAAGVELVRIANVFDIDLAAPKFIGMTVGLECNGFEPRQTGFMGGRK